MVQFTEADLVQLKSGGPLMTVAGGWSDSAIIVSQWFCEGGLREGQFRPTSLVKGGARIVIQKAA
jgi:uncharacterized protein YodC (DUF2158 family)